jgi:osmotically-inducible protein OsmY
MSKTRDVRQAVEAELRLDPLLDSSGIMVENVGGDVTLDGTVPGYPHYLQAARAARRAAGVTRVHNNLEVVLPPGEERDDPLLTTAANNALALDHAVPDTVEAEARHANGRLTLTGTVRYGSQRAAAEAAVAALPGVRGIRNKIKVEYDTEPADVTLQVERALARTALVPGDSEVKAATAGNTVTLTGHVRTAAEHDAVVGATWMANGVQEVIDEIHVTG